QPLHDSVEDLAGDGRVAVLASGRDLRNGLDRARRTQRLLPADLRIGLGELLELRADLGQCLLPARAGDLAVAEEAPRGGHTADLQTFALQRFVALADDELGGTTTDVDH